MKKCIIAVLLFLTAAAPLSAEVRVKHHTHTDAYYYGGTTTPEVNRDYEIWLGEGKIALVEENTKMIFDVTDSILIFVNSSDSIYLETKMPLDWADVIVEEEVGRIQMYQYTGEMKDLGEKKEIEGHDCAAHMLTTWIPYQDVKYNEGDNVTWYTEDVPFDLSLYRKAFPCVLALRNYNSELIELLGEGKGYPMRSEETRFQKGIEIKTVTTVEDISEMDAPDGLWGVPDGYDKKDRITIQELQGS